MSDRNRLRLQLVRLRCRSVRRSVRRGADGPGDSCRGDDRRPDCSRPVRRVSERKRFRQRASSTRSPDNWRSARSVLAKWKGSRPLPFEQLLGVALSGAGSPRFGHWRQGSRCATRTDVAEVGAEPPEDASRRTIVSATRPAIWIVIERPTSSPLGTGCLGLISSRSVRLAVIHDPVSGCGLAASVAHGSTTASSGVYRKPCLRWARSVRNVLEPCALTSFSSR